MTIDQLNTLHQRHLSEFRVFALSLTRDGDLARDLLQEVSYQFLKNRNSFQYGTDFAAWGKRIIRNVFLSGYRRGKRRRGIIQRYGIPAGWAGDRSVNNTGVNALEEEDVRATIAQLPEIYRGVFLLAYQGLSYQEIALRSGVSVSTVKSRLFTARSILKKKLRRRGDMR